MRRSVRENFNCLVQRSMARETRRFLSGALSTEPRRAWWMRMTAWVMAVVTYLSPIAFIFDNAAHAAPIVDPRAPIAFRPTITQTSTGIPAVNIAPANSQGISLNQYSTFDVTPAGLVLNNSTTGGTPLLGGTLGVNPNLGGRPASLIINQVTLAGPASQLLGVLEVFGS